MIAKRFSLAMFLAVAVSAALLLDPQTSDAACSSCESTTCEANRLCIFTGDGYTGTICRLQKSNPTLDLGGCTNPGCTCFNNANRSIRNSYASTRHFRVYSGLNYGGAGTMCFPPGFERSGSSQLGTLYLDVESEKHQDGSCP